MKIAKLFANDSWGKLKSKGPKFYLKIQWQKIKRRNQLFGWLFRNLFTYYKVDGVRIQVDDNLYPPPLYSRFFFRIYEQEEIFLTKKYLNGSETILELGACIGVVSCVVNKKLKNPENHVIVEANPELIPHLETNKALNRSRFSILNAIISDKPKESFYVYNSALSGSMTKHTSSETNSDNCREHSIQGITPQEIEKKYGVNFDTLIMDIEGGEYELIENYIPWLKNLSKLMIEFHPNRLEKDKDKTVVSYIELLRQQGEFKLIEEFGGTYVFQKI